MKRGSRPDFDAYAGDLFGEMMLADTAAASTAPTERKPLSRFVPGLAICAIASAAAAWLAQNYGVPIILAGLLLGLALNFAAGDARTHEGLDATVPGPCGIRKSCSQHDPRPKTAAKIPKPKIRKCENSA